jgi:hypothetical protein
MYRRRARAMCAALGLASAVARAEGAAPASSEGWHSLPAVAAASWSRLPRDGTWVGGVALALGGPATTLTVTGDAIRLREPGPEGIHAGMLLVGGYLGGRIAGGDRAWLRADLGGSLFFAVFGDVGVGAPGLGGGLAGAWHVAPSLALVASAHLTVPIPIADSWGAVRLSIGRATISAGWRDVRFVPVLGLPGRYSSGPQIGVGFVFH